MTNEQAITNLKMIRVAFVEPVTDEQGKLIDDTFDMAISALENNYNSAENNHNSAKEDTAESYEWCTGCREYDNEKHCCHRYTNFIRYSLQENIDSVLEGIKAEIEKEMLNAKSTDYLNGLNMALMIINEKHISGKR